MVVEGILRNLSRRKYCLDCSPFGAHRTRHPDHETLPTSKACKRCGEHREQKDFYKRRNGSALHSYCIECSKQEALERQHKLKLKAIEYLGGCCQNCGYNRCPAAMDFHHLDPNQKDFSIGQASKTSFEKIKSELDKCALLCSRCHREVEAGFIELQAPPSGVEPDLTISKTVVLPQAGV